MIYWVQELVTGAWTDSRSMAAAESLETLLDALDDYLASEASTVRVRILCRDGRGERGILFDTPTAMLAVWLRREFRQLREAR